MFGIVPLLFCLFGMKRIMAFGERSPLQVLIQNHALRTTVLNEIVTDLLDKPVIVHMIDTSIKHFDFFYITITAISVSYLHYQSNTIQKLKVLPYYQENYKKYKLWLFIVMAVFTKNIENAI